MPPNTPPPRQLDIFEDSPDVMWRNDAADALLRREPAAARVAQAKLAAAFPADELLSPIGLLAGFLSCQGSQLPLTDPQALAVARQRLQDEIAPAAACVFGSQGATHFMRAEWHGLAVRASGVPFQSARPDDHAAPLWLQAEAWEQAVRAVLGIESWRRIPQPLAWMTQARCRLGEVDGCWPLIAELAWLSPRRLDRVIRSLGEQPLLTRLAKAFGANFDGRDDIDDLAWFPAWLLTQVPALAERLSQAWPSQDSPAERAMRLMIELLGLERQGRHADLVVRRRALRDLNLPLYDAYMKTR